MSMSVEERRARDRARYAANPEKYRNKTRQWRKKNPDKVTAQGKKYWAENKQKSMAAVAAWKAQHPEWRKTISRKVALKKKYGITVEQYDELLSAQDGKCALCCAESATKAGSIPFSVDHCHVTGGVRGLLCNKCNVGLGLLGDTYESIMKAAEYLWKHSLPKRIAA